ncbi:MULTISPECIES: zinc-dependent peptidase [unclassified Acidovorax]|uniref:M90 family metallopeptidase n=1 Tax=unclassified Acidovorax TaxID=2684926 RepID=UPI0028831F5D|nr:MULTISPECIES: zinc-dependent peptidase [unclassified Acidovorax]
MPALLPRALRRFVNRVRATLAPVPDIDVPLWLQTLRRYPFLAALTTQEQSKLRALSALFLQRKQFTGAHGFEVTDAMAVAIAAQACLPLLHWGDPAKALAWYDDFVGIVVHPGEAVARRQAVDDAGVVHDYDEVLLGEAMERGPVMLSWPAVDGAGRPLVHAAHGATASTTTDANGSGTSVVIHEFVHKLDMQGGHADGCPPLPSGFLGTRDSRTARTLWRNAWAPAYYAFREKVIIAERFGGERPWLDGYGATAPAEFFAVACEAYFVSRTRFAQEFPTLMPLLDAFFHTAD